jgi:hypothetical protein
MSQPPPSYPGPPGYPPGQPPLPAKKRPSGWWFVVGGALIVAAIAAGVGLFVWTLSGFLATDARIPADGRAHQVTVGTGEDRMLWLENGLPQECGIVDLETGDPITLDPVAGSYERSDSHGSFRGVARLDPGSGDLEVTCRPAGTAVIGPAPKIGSFVGGLLATIFVPLLLGLSGLAVLIVTGILFASRPARPGAYPSG